MECPGSDKFHGHIRFIEGPREGEELDWMEGKPFPEADGYYLDLNVSHREACGGICLHALYI